jgi:antitoxin (DNA-binding transcriptional repressor) of toxin-antitoxin stability system
VDKVTVSIRDLRLKFPEIRKKIERYGEVVITDNGVPAYTLQPVASPKRELEPIDYWARLQRQGSKPLDAARTKSLHEENRGDH